VAYGSVHSRKPFERASKIAHSQIINDPQVVAFVEQSELPAPPEPAKLRTYIETIPADSGCLQAVIAIDGGMTETFVRSEFPSASIGFITMGPLLLRLDDLRELDEMPFIGPEDMARLRSIQRYSLAYPTKLVRYGKSPTFSEGFRRRIHEFLVAGDGHLLAALAWLIHRGWRNRSDQDSWVIPRCPNLACSRQNIAFVPGGPDTQVCSACGRPIFLSDALRLYERVDEEQGASAVQSYLLTALEQVILVHLVRTILDMKPALLRDVLFIKDGPLAFFGVTAPLYKPMRELMIHLGDVGAQEGSLISLIGVQKSGAFVDHAIAMGSHLRPYELLLPDSEYIYRYIVPGDPTTQDFGRNTYYGSTVIFKGGANDLYVGNVPTGDYHKAPRIGDLFNAGDVLRTTCRLKCSMYDNALLPIALANRLVSLADIPSAEILKKFAQQQAVRR
jgi:hypothetical protein